MQGRLSNVKATRDNYQTQVTELNSSLNSEQAARQQTVCYFFPSFLLYNYFLQEERVASLESLAVKKKRLVSLDKELDEYGACDPAKVEELKRGITLAKEAAIRWTGGFPSICFDSLIILIARLSDNYAALLSYFTRQNSVNPEDVRKYLNIGDDYEELC
jgi:hypothetical protein